MSRLGLALVLAFLSLTQTAHADEASKRAKIRELFALNGMQARLEQNKVAAAQQYHQVAMNVTGTIGLSPAQDRIASAYYDKINELLAQAYDWKKLEPAYEDVYNKIYTEEEIDGVVAFYQSPVGKAYSAKNPAATAATIEVSNRLMSDVTPKLKKLAEELITNLSAAPAQ
jgi:hypothetical protein